MGMRAQIMKRNDRLSYFTVFYYVHYSYNSSDFSILYIPLILMFTFRLSC